MISSEQARRCCVAGGDGSTSTPANSRAVWTLAAGVATANIGSTTWVGGAGCPVNNHTVADRLFASYLSCLDVAATPASPAAVDSKDDKQPYTDSWSFTISQKAPWKSFVEVAYVGNRSRDLANSGGAGSNLNLVPVGAMLTAANPANADPKFYRPLNDPVTGNGYGDVNKATNNAYTNYNAMQIDLGTPRGALHHSSQLHPSEGFGNHSLKRQH